MASEETTGFAGETDGSAEYVLGIDEAGRGPVLGPMVYSAAVCRVDSLDKLEALGVDDSKQMSESDRETMRSRIESCPYLHYSSTILSAEELSAKMLRANKYNLNSISHDTALALVDRAYNQGIPISEVYVDTVGNPETYASKFRERFPRLRRVVVEKKADATYRIVGAASIVAKTTRDRMLKNWKFEEEEGGKNKNDMLTFGRDFGSGYPSDPRTKLWLKTHVDKVFGFPRLVRFSWSTVTVLLEKYAVAVHWYVCSKLCLRGWGGNAHCVCLGIAQRRAWMIARCACVCAGVWVWVRGCVTHV